jgi:hypothetical protein
MGSSPSRIIGGERNMNYAPPGVKPFTRAMSAFVNYRSGDASTSICAGPAGTGRTRRLIETGTTDTTSPIGPFHRAYV